MINICKNGVHFKMIDKFFDKDYDGRYEAQNNNIYSTNKTIAKHIYLYLQ